MEAILNDNGKRVDNMKWGGGSDKSLIDMTKKVKEFHSECLRISG